VKKIIFFIFIVLVACSNEEEEPMLTKGEPEQESIQEEISEKPVEKENLNIEFSLEEEIITLNTENIPILENYLDTVPKTDVAIEKMELTKLEPERLYLLTFNCQEKTCSNLLLDRNTPNRSFLIDDLVHIKDTIPSTDNSKLLIILEEKQVDRFMVFNLADWTPTKFTTSVTMSDDIRITSGEWIEEETIHLEYTVIADDTVNEIELTEENIN